MHVLLAEDDHRLGSALVRVMADQAITADLVDTGKEAVHHAAANDYAAIVLDASLPDADGIDVCRTIRGDSVNSPIIMLSARDSVEDRIAGLDSGADDWLGKPFSARELLARMRAVTRRGPLHHPVQLVVGDLTLDPTRHQVSRGGTPIALSHREFSLLQAFMRHPGAVLSRFYLLEQAWGYGYDSRSNVVEVYIRYLREKIDRPFGRRSLATVRGVGYRLSDDDG